MRFPIFHFDWNENYFGNICTIRSGIGFKADEYVEQGVPLLKIDNVGYGNIKWNNISYLPETYLKQYPFLKLNENDIVLALNRPITNNQLKISKLTSKDIPSILYQRVGKINVSSDYNLDYIYYLLTKNVFDFVLKTSIGSDQPFISTENLKKLIMKVPTITEQQKIGHFLSLIDQRIQTQIKIIELKQSLIKDIEDRILWKTTNTQTKPIREFLTEINNKSIIQNQYPLLSSTKKGLFLQTDYFNKEAASSNNIGYKIVHKGDIIISPQNLWMGNITYNDKFDNGLVSPSYRIYKVKEEYNAFYISRILMSYRALSLYKNISEQGASIVRRNLNVDAFNELCFPIPNIKKQDEVGLFLSKLHQELKCETWILMQLKSQKNYLLNNMFI